MKAKLHEVNVAQERLLFEKKRETEREELKEKELLRARERRFRWDILQ